MERNFLLFYVDFFLIVLKWGIGRINVRYKVALRIEF